MFSLLAILVVTAKTADEWNNEGAGLLIEGNYEEALKAFDRILEIEQQNTKAWNNKEFTPYLLERHEEAIGCCDKVLEINPQDVGVWNNKGLALYGLGRYEEAIECFNKALDTDPQYIAAQNNKEAALNELGRTEEVKSTLSVVTASSEYDTLKKGDIVYRSGAWIFGHCGIYIGKNEEGIDTVIEVMDEDYVPPNGGAREISLEDFKNTKGRKYLGAKTVPKLDENKRNEIVEFAKKVLDETKDEKIQYKLLISNQEVGVVKDGKKLYNCVSFVEEAYASVGIDLVTGDCTLTPKWQRKSPKLIDVKSELPEDKDLGGIDFSSIQLNYISLPSDQNEKTFSYVLKAKKTEEEDKIIDIEDATELSLSAFFIGLSLPNSKFWVNLGPLEPDVITDEDLRKTDVGRIMLEADLQMKKDICKYENPCESEIGEEFWALLDKKSEELIEECMRKHPNEIEDADNVLFGIVSRNWIVPDKTEVYVTDGEVYIVDIALNVKSEPLYEDSFYLIVNQNLSLSDECKEDLSEASKEYGRYAMELTEEMILPLVVQEVNHGGYYSDLRRVYTSLALAQWYKDKYWHTSGIFTDFIDTNDLTGLESKYMWDAEEIWRDYVKSFEEGEYRCMKDESHNYKGGGVIFTDINLTDIGDMPSDLKELTSEAVDSTFANEGDYYYLGDSARLYALGEAANWSHFGYDGSYTAYNPLESTINITNVAQLKRRWGIGCDDGYFSVIHRSPAIYNGTLYTSGAGSRLTAYDAQTGHMLWQFGKGNAGWAPQPVVSEDGIVFYMEETIPTYLYAVEANSGNMLWQAPIGFDLGFRGAAEAVVTIDEVNDLVYIVECGEGKFFALDKQTGEIVWYKSKATDKVSFKGNYVLLNAGKIFAAAEVPVQKPYLRYLDRMLCVNASSQDIEIIFDKPEGIELDDISKYTLCNDKLIVTFCDRADSAESIGTLVVYNVTSQAVVWQKEYSTAITGRIACNTAKKVIYVPTDPYLYALNATTGEEVWKYMGYGAIYSPSIANAIVYFISDTNMYAIDENTGEKLFFYPLGHKGGETTQVAICDGMVYFSGNGGTCDLYALGLPAMRFAKVILFLTTP